jgi:hypothetical protein
MIKNLIFIVLQLFKEITSDNFIFLIISIILRNKIGYAGAKYLGGEFQYLPENLVKFNLKISKFTFEL